MNENDDPARELIMYFSVEMILRGYHTYQSVWVNVGKQLPCQREQANSEDPFQCFYNKISQFSIELLDP